MSDIFNKWKNSLERTRKIAFGRLINFFGASEITVDTWDELEALLIQADLGIDTTSEIISALINKTEAEGIISTAELRQHLAVELENKLMFPEMPDLSNHQPAVILVVGVNGSGKTTTFRMIMGLLESNGGTVLLDGKPIDYSVTDKIGFLTEERSLLTKLTVFDQVIYYGRLKGMTKDEIEKKLDYWLERLEIKDYKYRKKFLLSNLSSLY